MPISDSFHDAQILITSVRERRTEPSSKLSSTGIDYERAREIHKTATDIVAGQHVRTDALTLSDMGLLFEKMAISLGTPVTPALRRPVLLNLLLDIEYNAGHTGLLPNELIVYTINHGKISSAPTF